MASRLARIPGWAWVTGLVVVSFAVRYVLARRIVAPWIMVDELIYSELAKSFASGGHFLLRGQSTGAYGYVYPGLLAPAWAAFHRVPQAYAAAKVVNSLVVSLAAVPAYLLARRVLSRWYALAAAALAMSLPMLLFAGMLMTENAFYPAFLLMALATVLWLERPDLRRSAFVLGAFVLAYLTRAEAVAVLPALATAPFLVSGRRALREFRWFFVAGAAAIVFVVVLQVGRGASIFGVFGAYEVAGHAGYSAAGVSRWLLYHWEELILSVGIVPFAATGTLALTMRGRPRPERAFLAATVALSFWLVLEVAAFASEQSLRVEERNMFYVVPLLLIGLMLWVERGCPRPWPAAGVAVAAAVALPAALPYSMLIGLPAISDTSALLPLWSLAPSVGGIASLRWVVLGVGLAACLLFLFLPRRYALVIPLLVLVYFGVSQKPIEAQYRKYSILDQFQGITASHPDWVDRAVGRNADVTLIWTGNTDKYSIWENEFFNRSVRRFYYTAAPLTGDLPEKPLAVDRKTVLMHGPGGAVVRARYVLTDRTANIGGTVVAQDAKKQIVLLRVGGGPVRQVALVDGLYPQDTWSGPAVTYTRLDCRGGAVVVKLQSDPSLFSKPSTVVASVDGREVARTQVAPEATKLLRVPVTPHGHTCAIHFAISPTLVPAKATKGQNPDPRELGVHFSQFTYRP